MRPIHALPLVAAVLLAACGGGGDADADGDGAISGVEVAAEAEGMVQPKPGQYRTTLELIEFNAPGVPDSAREQMQQAFASGLAEGNTFCMTEAEAAENGPRQMVENLAESDCEMSSFNVSGNTVVAEMQCAGPGGGKNTVKMEGEMTAESSTMTMDLAQDLGAVGNVAMKMRVASQRTGDCTT
jgi:hypothetical protein